MIKICFEEMSERDLCVLPVIADNIGALYCLSPEGNETRCVRSCGSPGSADSRRKVKNALNIQFSKSNRRPTEKAPSLSMAKSKGDYN